jgi:AAA15 family ATPase/GTPase
MLNKAKFENFGPLTNIEWDNLGKINLVIGKNDSGKSFLLKALYATMRTLEKYKRGDNQSTAPETLADKLYWTFQSEKIGDLVTKGADKPLLCNITFDGYDFRYSFGKDTTKQISSLENHVLPRSSNSIFLPAKEVLSLHHIILQSRRESEVFGFDDTYLDLADALNLPKERGKNYTSFSNSRRLLEDIIGGRVEYETGSRRWVFVKGKYKFAIGVTAEGFKKIGILDTLLGNRFLDPNSVVFIDEPESALHPKAISDLLDIIALLAEEGIQFFMASHSYFVVEKLFLIAQEKKMSIPVISKNDSEWTCSDLKDGMPNNPIIGESIRLYQEEMEMALG